MIRSNKNLFEESFEAWKEGMTGVPFIDACMRQVNATGYMSNRGRQNVASFFVFELELDWRLGAAYFEEVLIDHDVASNYGNWLAAANLLGGRKNRFNITKQSMDYDPEGRFIRKWVPELQNVPISKLFEPWKMSHKEMSKARCLIGEDYPENMVELIGWNPSGKKKKKGKRWHQGKGDKKYYTS